MNTPTLERPAPAAAAPVRAVPPPRDTRRRSLLKAVSWRLLGTLGTMAGAWVITGEWGVTIALGTLEALAKFALFYLHERVWERLG